jgi:hypothetical protein
VCHSGDELRVSICVTVESQFDRDGEGANLPTCLLDWVVHFFYTYEQAKCFAIPMTDNSFKFDPRSFFLP